MAQCRQARAEALLLGEATEAVSRPRPTGEKGSHLPEPAFWNRRRPQHLLTGRVFCGCCSGPYVNKGKDYMGYQADVVGACRNRRSIRRHHLEGRVLAALRRDLMDPDAVEAFIGASAPSGAAWSARQAATPKPSGVSSPLPSESSRISSTPSPTACAMPASSGSSTNWTPAATRFAGALRRHPRSDRSSHPSSQPSIATAWPSSKAH